MSHGSFVARLCISKRGHDKGSVYVILCVVDDKFVLVANGQNRQAARPKRKNIAHITITDHRAAATSDTEIIRAIKIFKKECE